MTKSMGSTDETPDSDAIDILAPEDWARVPDELKPKIVEVFSARFELIRSPLLPPELLQKYNDAVPGLAEKLVAWTEQETDHRRAMEKASFDEVRTLRSRSQVFGICTALFGLGVAGLLAAFSAKNGSVAGTVTGSIIAIVSVGGPFAARILAMGWRKGSNADEQD